MTRLASALIILCLLQVAGCATKAVERQWYVVRAPEFTLYGDIGQGALRRDAMDLERFSHAAQKMLTVSIPKDAPPTRVFVFNNADEFRPYAESDRVGGWLHMSHRHPVIAMTRAPDKRWSRHMIYAGYVYYLLEYDPRHLPRWYQAGLAHLLSTADIRSNRVIVGDVSDVMRREIGYYGWPTASLSQITADDYDYAHAKWWRREFLQYWAVVHYCLLDNRKFESDLDKYLTLRTRDHIGNDAAFRRAFGMSADDLWHKVVSYFRNNGRVWRGTIDVKRAMSGVLSQTQTKPHSAGRRAVTVQGASMQA